MSRFLWIFQLLLYWPFVTGNGLAAQNLSRQLSEAGQTIKKYADSLDYATKEFEKGQIGHAEYHLEVYRISTEISILAGLNLEMTYPTVDSILNAHQYDQDRADGFILEEPEDSSDFYRPDDKKRNSRTMADILTGLTVPRPYSRTHFEWALRTGLTFNTGNRGEGFNNPAIRPFDNIYMDNFQIALRTKIGGHASRFHIRYGMGLDLVNLRQTRNIQELLQGDSMPVRFDDEISTLRDLKESKLSLSYLHFPIGMVWHLNNKIRIIAGFYINLLVGQKNSTINRSSSTDYKVVESRDFGFTRSVPGIHCDIHYKRIGIFWEAALLSVFPADSPTDLRYHKVGILIR